MATPDAPASIAALLTEWNIGMALERIGSTIRSVIPRPIISIFDKAIPAIKSDA
jgi:hypothetical protein